MSETTDKYGQVLLSVEILRRSMIENGMSLMFDKETHELIFFETDHYIESGRVRGFKKKLEDLVK